MAPGVCLMVVATAAFPDAPWPTGQDTDLPFPTLLDQSGLRRQEVGKDVGGAATVRTVDDADVLVGQAEAAVVSLQRGVIPFLDLAQEDPGNGVRRQLELTVRDTVQVVRQRFGAERARELDDLVTAAHGIGF